MAAFVNGTFGRYVSVRSYVIYKNGKARKMRAYLRKWPGSKNRLYFKY